MTKANEILRAGDALIVVDVQKDFCPGGALPIENGDLVVPVLNRWIDAAAENGIPVYFSRDWHPVDHISFKNRGGPWPPHCIQDSDGADFHPDLKLPKSPVIVTKGVRFDQDQNSAFDQTGLAQRLREEGVKRLFVGGLAEDVCVLATVVDGIKEGFDVTLIFDATRPVSASGGAKALKKMRDAGTHFKKD
jgi:nicotinamidase/pyrazinamidase